MKCTECGEKESNHNIRTGDGAGKRIELNLCCVCYVKSGRPPADWHRECMETYHDLQQKNVNKI